MGYGRNMVWVMILNHQNNTGNSITSLSINTHQYFTNKLNNNMSQVTQTIYRSTCTTPGTKVKFKISYILQATSNI